jgi:glycosyltransferase involved in cell wall biosynthesis
MSETEERGAPLNILLTNYRYFLSGGPERYLFNVKALLESKGHEVIPFSVKHPRNEPTPYSEYFLTALTDDPDAVAFRDIKLTPGTLARLADRTFLSVEARRNMGRLLDSKRIDVAYTLHFLRWISPSIFGELKRRAIPIVVRVSDFEYMCPGTHLLRNGEVCETCVGGSLLPSVQHKCLQGSLPLSLAHYLSMSLYKLMGALDKIDAFVCPSRFTLGQMEKAGFKRDKLFHVPTFIDTEAIRPSGSPGGYILYTGRISVEKGVDVLVEAYEKLRSRSGDAAPGLCIIHTGGEEARALEARADSGDLTGVTILSGLSQQEFHSHVAKAALTVVPSLCYDNMPNVILESYAHGKPVVGSNRGSIPEVVHDGKTGLLFEPGDGDDLAEKLAWLAGHPRECAEMGAAGRSLVENEHNVEAHYGKLMDIFARLK